MLILKDFFLDFIVMPALRLAKADQEAIDTNRLTQTPMLNGSIFFFIKDRLS